MGFHTFPLERAEKLEDPDRFRLCSAEELAALIDPNPGETVVDLGSGTGFFTEAIAPYANRVLAIDVQPAMHGKFKEKGLPANVDCLAGIGDRLPLAPDSVGAVFSTMTYHEYADEATMAELARVLDSGGRHVAVDWNARGADDQGPPLDERFTVEEARTHHETAGFDTEWTQERPNTFVYVGIAP